MRNRSGKIGQGAVAGRPASPRVQARAIDEMLVVDRRCTVCDREARVIEQGVPEDPLCPWCYATTERTSVVGVVIPEALGPADRTRLAASLGRLGGLKGGLARARKLTARQRSESAARAARARWKKSRAAKKKSP